jgi:hemerythrin
MIYWRENYNFGISEIDKQHQKLIDIIQALQCLYQSNARC